MKLVEMEQKKYDANKYFINIPLCDEHRGLLLYDLSKKTTTKERRKDLNINKLDIFYG